MRRAWVQTFSHLPQGWRHSRAVERDKAGQGSATPNQGGAAPIPAPLPGLQACLFQLFKLFQSARTRATFGKQLLISRAESVGFICGVGGEVSSGSWGLMQPSSGHAAPPPTGTPARGHRASCVSWSRGGGFSEAGPASPAREGRARALAPPSGGGRRSGATARLATRAVLRSSECRGVRRSHRHRLRSRVRAAPRQLGQGRRRGAPEQIPSSS